ncbi:MULTISPECIES: 4-oxalocrotonate tautomerase family protein [unclassified Burkholderia]|uniref:4-oxalocrotonate tautomerase family protein n=1 Tax=unclassified Burkholderia TaxID=2613784 RepID=UPI000F5A5185|nr:MULTISPECIES: 4-oxalocrotonate tautomerase family protein [unclassified Burkholderia]RQS06049.1 4-oxalocrotonate tautomerase family protein [Burkholderia sp. Bp8991]
MQREAIVPVAHLYILEGRDDDKKERLIAEVSEAIHRSLDAPLESVRVIITEMPKAHFGIGGQSAKKRGR